MSLPSLSLSRSSSSCSGNPYEPLPPADFFPNSAHPVGSHIQQPVLENQTLPPAGSSMNQVAEDTTIVAVDCFSQAGASSAVNKWTLEEEVKLGEMIEKWRQKDGKIPWGDMKDALKKQFPDKDLNSCQRKYFRTLRPAISDSVVPKISIWTPEEDALLIKMTEEWRRKDKKIPWKDMEDALKQQLPGRNEGACRNRYVTLVSTKRSEIVRPQIRHWTDEEADTLKSLVEKFRKSNGRIDWLAMEDDIKVKLPGKDLDSCKKKYASALKHTVPESVMPQLKYWNPEVEDPILLRLIDKYRKSNGFIDWKGMKDDVENQLPGKDVDACQSRYDNHLKHQIPNFLKAERNPWTSKEDEILKALMEKHRKDNKEINWPGMKADINDQLPGKDPTSCYNRSTRISKPENSVSTHPQYIRWTPEEDDALKRLIKKWYDSNCIPWQNMIEDIRSQLPRRSWETCKNRYDKVLRTQLDLDKTAYWSGKETQYLVKLVEKYIDKGTSEVDWVKAEADLREAFRTRRIKERDIEVCKNHFKKSREQRLALENIGQPWTKDSDDCLVEIAAKYKNPEGSVCWEDAEEELNERLRRNKESCQDRYRKYHGLSINRKKWSPEYNNRFLEIVNANIGPDGKVSWTKAEKALKDAFPGITNLGLFQRMYLKIKEDQKQKEPNTLNESKALPLDLLGMDIGDVGEDELYALVTNFLEEALPEALQANSESHTGGSLLVEAEIKTNAGVSV